MWKVNEIAYSNNLLLVVACLFYHVRDTAGQYVSLKAWFWCPENVLKFCNFYVLKKVKLLCSGLLYALSYALPAALLTVIVGFCLHLELHMDGMVGTYITDEAV